MANIKIPLDLGNATEDDVLMGKTFSTNKGVAQTGNMNLAPLEEAINNLNNLVGDEPVSVQIDNKVLNKADKVHSHQITDVTNLEISLDSKVPTTREINGKALSSDITLSAADVGADESGSSSAALEEAKVYTDNSVSKKADKVHNHDDMYYTENEVDTVLLNITNNINNSLNAKQNKLSWVTDSDIDAMFAGNYVGNEDEDADGTYTPTITVDDDMLIIGDTPTITVDENTLVIGGMK